MNTWILDTPQLHDYSPQTLEVLYRMRPIIRAQVGSGSRVGRVRYSCLKEAARGEAFMQIGPTFFELCFNRKRALWIIQTKPREKTLDEPKMPSFCHSVCADRRLLANLGGPRPRQSRTPAV